MGFLASHLEGSANVGLVLGEEDVIDAIQEHLVHHKQGVKVSLNVMPHNNYYEIVD